MKDLLLTTAINALRWYVGTGVFTRIASLVAVLNDEDIPGPEKREKVVEFTRKEYGLIAGAATNIVIDAIIAFTRLRLAVYAEQAG